MQNSDHTTSSTQLRRDFKKILTSKGEIVEQQGKGRHDPCVVPRAVPIVEAMAALFIIYYFLLNKI